MQIAAYFSSPIEKKCGICDNCINQQALEVSEAEFDEISGNILLAAREGLQTIGSFTQHFTKNRKAKFWKVLDYLQAEKKIFLNKEGKIVEKI